jgi:hypothetical protein
MHVISFFRLFLFRQSFFVAHATSRLYHQAVFWINDGIKGLLFHVLFDSTYAYARIFAQKSHICHFAGKDFVATFAF